MAGASLAALAASIFGTGALGSGDDTYLAAGSLIDYWTTTTWAGVVVGAVAGICGGILMSLNRTVLTAGVMVALALIPTATMMPIALLAGDLALAAGAGVRFVTEVLVVIGGTALVFVVKRRGDHRGSST